MHYHRLSDEAYNFVMSMSQEELQAFYNHLDSTIDATVDQNEYTAKLALLINVSTLLRHGHLYDFDAHIDPRSLI